MSVPPPAYPDDVLAAALAHARARAPEESCGVVVRHRDGLLRYRPLDNDADRYRAADPAAWPWTARDSFVLSPAGLIEVLRAHDRGDATLVAVVHSHPDGRAELSARDRAGALDDAGRPVLPAAEQLVVGLADAARPELRAHRHEAEGWSARGVPLPPAPALAAAWRWPGKLSQCRNSGR